MVLSFGPTLAETRVEKGEARYGSHTDPVLRSLLTTETASPASSMVFPGIESNSDPIYPCFIQWDEDTELPLPDGCRVIEPGIATARLTRSQLQALARDGRVRSLQAARRVKANLDTSVPEIGASVVHGKTEHPPIYSGFTGQNIIIGVVDTGIDLTHLDFITDGTHRVLSVWDQTGSSSQPPNGFGYGHEWSAAEIQAGVATMTDPQGHGTHVLGTAAGSGGATGNGQPTHQFVGVAPGASLIVVKTDFWTSSIVDGVDYVFEQADALGLPAVVNLSLGHHYGPHDGTESTDLAINALVAPGKIVVAAAGNEQEYAIHAEALVGSEIEEVTLSVPAYSPQPGAENDLVLIDGYYSASELLHVSIRTPSGRVLGPIGPGLSIDTATEDGWITLENDVFDPPTVDRNFFIQISDKEQSRPPGTGTWTLIFENISETSSAGEAQTDMWLYQQTLSNESPPVFTQGMTARKLIGSPASADSVIAVAAYVTRSAWPSLDGNSYSYNPPPVLGTIAPFSAQGPRRDGVQKPDIAAPGMGIASALSATHAVGAAWTVPDGQHFILQGTSMASPHVTGVIALMLESFGPLSHSEVLAQLRSTARADEATGSVPNPIWGHGKLDAAGATAFPSPLLVSGAEIHRTTRAIELRWSVPPGSSSLRFRIERETAVERSASQTKRASRLFVAEVGPGPEYTFSDAPFLDADVVEYWLTPLAQGVPGKTYGPFQAVWNTDSLTFSLSSPFPNPAHDDVRWTLSLPEAGPVRVELFDPQGRRVRTIFDDVLPAGVQSFAWNGRNDGGVKLGSGVYWIHSSSREWKDSRRVLLLR